jgi:hypothetical protein
MIKKDGKKPRREQVKHAALNPRYNSRVRQEYIDQDYINELDDKIKNCKLPNGDMVTELEYLSLFMEEWNNASVGKQSEAENNVFHRTAKEVKDCTDRNNFRNGDLYGLLRNKADKYNNKKLLNYESLVGTLDPSNPSELEHPTGHDPRIIENAYIDFIESQEIERMLQEYDQAMLKFTEPSEPLQSREQSLLDPLEPLKS